MTSTRSIIEEIETAFDAVEYPGDDNLTDSQYGEEPELLKAEFRGKTDWKTLESEFLDQAPGGWGTALSFFSAQAFRFYLPAYLRADLRGDISIADPAFHLCMFVTPQAEGKRIAKVWGGGTMGEHMRDRFREFDCPQVRAIIAYLWWRLRTTDYDPTIEQALESYWLQREAGCDDTR